MLLSINQQEEQNQDEDSMDKVNINSININAITFNSKCSVITANLNTSSSHATSVIQYKRDLGSDGNIMPFYIFKNHSLGSTKELAAMKNENIKLRTYISTTITQLGRCTVGIENNNKIKIVVSLYFPEIDNLYYICKTLKH